MKQSSGIYYAGLAFVSIIWGMNFGISRWAMEDFSPEVFTFLRFGLSVPILFLILKWFEGNVGIERKDLLKFLVIGAIGVTALEIMVMYSIKFTTLANSSLLNVAPWPIFAALLAPLFIAREKMSMKLITGGAVAMIGVFLVILGGGQGFDMSSDYMIGNMMALIVSLIGALYNLACMPLMKKYSPLRVSAWCLLFGSVFMVPFTLNGWSAVAWSNLGAMSYLAITFNVLLCTVAAFLIWNSSMKRVGATKANFYRYLVPATAAIAGYLFFDEAIHLMQLVGGLIMVAGLVWIGSEKSDASDADKNKEDVPA
ncbi:DMT family transporter [Xylanibacillus composti]|uniref:Membrane protein n=1 Tax=Xylanibacillus composti TaxID=1572762 RepID=A0A8J4M271_9BACL|nr:DMT family transporter [Xylanibacillus composti]MDT9726030.1 DMT family transporter [Xylanibacillus composti]GIQ68825.1 membrane protein [Xylanibacillus composti]